MTEPYCWLCDDPESCEMCRPDEPGQLGLFDQPPTSATSNSARYSSASECDTLPTPGSKLHRFHRRPIAVKLTISTRLGRVRVDG